MKYLQLMRTYILKKYLKISFIVNEAGKTPRYRSMKRTLRVL